MPAQKISLGLKGLNEDLPPYTLPTDYFNSGVNMRVKDGSLQGVSMGILLKDPNAPVPPPLPGYDYPLLPIWDDTPTAPPTNATLEVNPVSFTPYIPDGFDYINTIIVGVDQTGAGRVRFSTNHNSLSIPGVVEIGVPSDLAFTYDHEYHVDNFVFNSIGIVNPKTQVPMYYNANLGAAGGTDMQPLPNWIKTNRTLTTPIIAMVVAGSAAGTTDILFATSGSDEFFQVGDFISRNGGATAGQTFTGSITGTTLTLGASTITLTAGDNIYGAGVAVGTIVTSTTGGVYTVNISQTVAQTSMTSGSPEYRIIGSSTQSVTISGELIPEWSGWIGNSPYQQSPYFARYMTTFQGRLWAFNLKRTQGANVPEYSVLEVAWSQPLSQLQSLTGIEWTAAATNSAGNDYLTETPGEVYCAVPLGEYLMVYKSDQVYKILNVGAPNYYEAQPLYTDDGIIGPRAVVEINESKHLYVGNNGVWLHQGGIEKQNITRGRVEEALYRGEDGIDFNYKGSVFCYHNKLEKEVWICYRSKTAFVSPNPNAADIMGCNRAYCYNYQTDTWYKRTLGNAVSTVNYQGITDIQDITAGGTNYTLACANATDFSAPTVPDGLWYFPHPSPDSIGIFEEDGYVVFNSRDVGTASAVKAVNGIYPHSGEPVEFKLKFTNYIKFEDFSPVLARRFDPENSNYRLDYRETGRYLHLRVSLVGLNNAGPITVNNPAANPRLTDFDIDLEMKGRR